ncbi:MAG: lysostaphin resistance A-like protein [Pseudomonadota bacterium]
MDEQALDFQELGSTGNAGWWRYVLGLVMVVFFWFASSVAAYGVLLLYAVISGLSGKENGAPGMLEGLDPLIEFAGIHTAFAVGIISLWIVVRFIHSRPFITLITAERSLDRKRLFRAFGLYWALLTALTAVAYLLDPSDIIVAFNAREFVRFLPVVLVLTPIQVAFEELLFRGYLIQAVGLITRRRMAAAAISAAIFLLPHLGNPEMAVDSMLTAAVMASYYFAFGFFLAVVTLRDNGLESALGIHIAHNLFVCIVLNYENSALKTAPLFYATKLDPTAALAGMIVTATLFYAVAYGWRRPD